MLLYHTAPVLRHTDAPTGMSSHSVCRSTDAPREVFAGVRVARRRQAPTLAPTPRTARNLASIDPGFRTESVLVADFDTRPARVPVERQAAFQRELRERIAAIPGVEAAATELGT